MRCHHHQGVAELGDGLVASARATIDNLVEAVEAADGSWTLGVQWHPEADERSRLFQGLAEAARERAARARSAVASASLSAPERS